MSEPAKPEVVLVEVTLKVHRAAGSHYHPAPVAPVERLRLHAPHEGPEALAALRDRIHAYLRETLRDDDVPIATPPAPLLGMRHSPARRARGFGSAPPGPGDLPVR